MDLERFDEFTRAMATGRSRRVMVKAAIAGVLGGTVTALRNSEAEAGKPCSIALDCPRNQVCDPVSGTCYRCDPRRGLAACKGFVGNIGPGCCYDPDSHYCCLGDPGNPAVYCRFKEDGFC